MRTCGDAVLREVAHRVDAEMRISDTGARFGGDDSHQLSQTTIATRAVAGRGLQTVRSHSFRLTKSATETVTLDRCCRLATPGVHA